MQGIAIHETHPSHRAVLETHAISLAKAGSVEEARQDEGALDNKLMEIKMLEGPMEEAALNRALPHFEHFKDTKIEPVCQALRQRGGPRGKVL